MKKESKWQPGRSVQCIAYFVEVKEQGRAEKGNC
jgi:hypothetical protein